MSTKYLTSSICCIAEKSTTLAFFFSLEVKDVEADLGSGFFDTKLAIHLATSAFQPLANPCECL